MKQYNNDSTTNSKRLVRPSAYHQNLKIQIRVIINLSVTLCVKLLLVIQNIVLFWRGLASLVCVCISINAGASSGIAASNGRRKYGLSKGRNMVGMCLYKYFIFLPEILVQIKKNLTISLDNVDQEVKNLVIV